MNNFAIVSRRMKAALGSALVAASVLAPGLAAAGTISIQSIFVGGVNNEGDSNGLAGGANMITGLTAGKLYNSYALFYIPPGQYSSANLTFTSFSSEASQVPEVKIGIFDVSTYYLQFSDTFHPGIDAYNDLGSGIQYGSATIGTGPEKVRLSGGALYDINASAGRYFMLGFTSFTANAMGIGAEGEQLTFINGINRPRDPFFLNLEPATPQPDRDAPVPEPSSVAMSGLGLALLGFCSRRRQVRHTALS